MINDNIHVGDIVYEAYSPQKVGKVIETGVSFTNEIFPGRSQTFTCGVRVRRLNGTEFVTGSPMNYRTLVEDHRRKAEKFATVLASLEAMP